MIVSEDGKLYEIDETTGLVTLAATEEAGLDDEPTAPVEFKGGERVTVGDKGGQVVAVTSSVYGDAVAVRHDDGSLDEYPAKEVKVANLDSHISNSENPLESFKTEFERYSEMPAYTPDEIDEKINFASRLHDAASVFIHRSSATSETAIVDQMAFQLLADIKDLKEQKMHATVTSEYLSSQPQYRMAENFSAPAPNLGMTGKGDASWVELEDGEGFTEVTEADIAARAVETVAQFQRHQLEDEDFVADAVAYQASYLGLTDEKDKARLAKFVEQARKDELAKPVEQKKEAAVDSLDDFDTASLFV